MLAYCVNLASFRGAEITRPEQGIGNENLLSHLVVIGVHSPAPAQLCLHYRRTSYFIACTQCDSQRNFTDMYQQVSAPV